MHSNKLSNILGFAYEAATDGAAWKAMVDRLLEEFQTPIGGFDFEAHKPDFNRDTAVSVNFDSTILQTYLDEFRTPDVNIGMRAFVNAPIGQAFNLWSFMDQEIYRSEASTVAVLHPQKIDKALMVTLNRSPTSFGFFSLYRRKDDDDFTYHQQAQLTLIASHIRRSWQLGERLSIANRAHNETAKNMEKTGTIRGMMVIGAGWRIVEADAAALVILAQRYGVSEQMGRLCSASNQPSQSTADLRGYIQRGLKVRTPFSISDRETYATTVHLYPGHIKSTTASAENFLRIEVITTLLRSNGGLGRFAAIYGLTKAESRVVSALTQAKNATQAAQKLGIARETMKSHLENIYPKVGARSISHLMFIAGRFVRSTDP